jgi:16S rRNA A1518/A1519 N6-dimethyltransferase RsmA/KsgA/DIM1 with predicted DNA glycosylase/AP lyase activity
LLSRLEIDPTARPETLAVADWIRLADTIFRMP